MAEPFIGMIIMTGFNFAPRGWALCNGQLLSIAQNTALFSLLGTQFGGNGQTTFGLPNLQGRVPIHQGQGAGLSSYTMGQQAGVENTTLSILQMPQHNHFMNASEGSGTAQLPANGFLAGGIVPSQGNAAVSNYRASSDGTLLAPGAISSAGGSQPFSILQPYLVVNFVIALEGIFPSRN